MSSPVQSSPVRSCCLSTEELKSLKLNILREFANFCEIHHINYFLDGGTLIGAVRHKGYIPWDDDIDVGMLRADYDKFTELFTNQGRYEFHCIENDPDYCFPYGKVFDTHTILYEPDKTGIRTFINIDIFVFDNAPLSRRTIRKIFIMRDFWSKCNSLRIMHHVPRGNILRRLFIYFLRALVRPFPVNYFARKISDQAKRYNSQPSGKIGNFTGYIRAVCDAEVLSGFITAEFEGRRYMIPARYDEWLRLYYGDYMKLPPESERVSHHTFEAYMIQCAGVTSGQQRDSDEK